MPALHPGRQADALSKGKIGIRKKGRREIREVLIVVRRTACFSPLFFPKPLFFFPVFPSLASSSRRCRRRMLPPEATPPPLLFWGNAPRYSRRVDQVSCAAAPVCLPSLLAVGRRRKRYSRTLPSIPLSLRVRGGTPSRSRGRAPNFCSFGDAERRPVVRRSFVGPPLVARGSERVPVWPPLLLLLLYSVG